MLKIWVKGFREDCIKDPGLYFNYHKDRSWFNRDDVRQVIKEIDDTIAVKDEYLESPVFGGWLLRDCLMVAKLLFLCM